MDLTHRARTKVAGALHIYYEDLISTVVDGISKALKSAERMPKLERPLPVILGGGSALPKGFAQMLLDMPVAVPVALARKLDGTRLA